MVMLLIFILDAKMGGLILIDKGKETPQGDLECIDRETCKTGTGQEVDIPFV